MTYFYFSRYLDCDSTWFSTIFIKTLSNRFTSEFTSEVTGYDRRKIERVSSQDKLSQVKQSSGFKFKGIIYLIYFKSKGKM